MTFSLKHHIYTLYVAFLMVNFMGCKSETGSFEVLVESIVDLDAIPSGSGIALTDDDAIVVVGDDAPYLYVLSAEYFIIAKHLIFPRYKNAGRIEKAIKPDLESIAVEVTEDGPLLYSFGSGSKSPDRDSLMVLNINTLQTPDFFSLTAFYKKVLKEMKLSRSELNIEGALIHNNYLYLFNRGNNGIVKVLLSNFRLFIEGRITPESLQLQTYQIALPEISGRKAGFSGACSLPERDKILFTATVEDTDNWIDDGQVLGSYVGILDIASLEKGAVKAIAKVAVNEQPIKDKVESIAFKALDSDGNIRALAIADNDNGTSRLFELRIKGF